MADEFDFGPERQYHTMKHFSHIDHGFIKKFLHQYRNYDGIEERLKKNVSKFHPDFADNPFSVIARLRNTDTYSIKETRDSEKRVEISMDYRHDLYPLGIGTDSIIKISDLDRKEKDALVMNGGVVYCNSGISPGITWTLNLILARSGSSFEVITFFPGLFAPPLPDKAFQTQEAFSESVEFWKEHAVIASI
ncbi:MAG: hypothetical protein K9J30_13025 [Bacteroidales bacterium]|nr:hypothetical protein [Bacteroidales bacterium]